LNRRLVMDSEKGVGRAPSPANGDVKMTQLGVRRKLFQQFNITMQQLPKIVRERLRAGQKAGVHPDPDLLTAFAEHSLSERERLPLLEHLSTCTECREVLSLAQPEWAIEHAAATPSASSKPRRSSRMIFNWATVAACIVAAVFLMRYQPREKGSIQIVLKDTSPAMNAGQTSKSEPPAATQPNALPSENELTAKLEPPIAPPTKSEARTESEAHRKKDSGQTRDRLLARPMAKKSEGAAASGAMAGALALRPVPQIPESSEQVTVTGQADATASTTQAEIPLQTRSFDAGVANQVRAAAAPSSLQKENQPTSPNPLPSAAGSIVSGAAVSGAVGGGNGSAAKARESVAQEAANRKLAFARISSNHIPARWTISADGSALLRSTDEGQTWNAVPVASNIVFRVVAALDPEVWVGGKAGALYHSSDLGAHWTQIKPTANGAALTADIVGIDFSDAQHGKLTTSEGKIWTTSDGGASWQSP
jgi:hypothetical protein